jgi:uncharacterized membrane protein YkoI
MKSSDVPQIVQSAFAKRFPSVKNVSWSREDASEFEAEFKNNGKEQSANFDANGNWLETETEIKKSDLPAAVQATLAKEFAGYKLEEAELTETSGGTRYEVELEKGESRYEVQLSEDGSVVKKEEKKEASEKNEKHGKKN